MAQEKKKSFVMYCDYRTHLSILTDEERGKLFMALLDYGENHTEPKLDGAALMAFSFIASQIDRDAAKYEETCRKRKEAGKKGGRPKAEGSEEEAKEPPVSETKETKTNTFEENQTEAKKANGFEENQAEAKKADTDNENDTDNDNENDTDNDILLLPQQKTPPKKKKKTPKGVEAAEEDPTPYKDIVNLYHEKCPSYPKLRKVSDKRKATIAARWKEYECNMDTFRELFELAEASSFLKGESESGWTADFNWLMNSENMAKVLEGKYKDKPKKEGKSYDLDDFFAAAVASSHKDLKEEPITAAEDENLRLRGEELKKRLAN